MYTCKCSSTEWVEYSIPMRVNFNLKCAISNKNYTKWVIRSQSNDIRSFSIRANNESRNGTGTASTKCIENKLHSLMAQRTSFFFIPSRRAALTVKCLSACVDIFVCTRGAILQKLCSSFKFYSAEKYRIPHLSVVKHTASTFMHARIALFPLIFLFPATSFPLSETENRMALAGFLFLRWIERSRAFINYSLPWMRRN